MWVSSYKIYVSTVTVTSQSITSIKYNLSSVSSSRSTLSSIKKKICSVTCSDSKLSSRYNCFYCSSSEFQDSISIVSQHSICSLYSTITSPNTYLIVYWCSHLKYISSSSSSSSSRYIYCVYSVIYCCCHPCSLEVYSSGLS